MSSHRVRLTDEELSEVTSALRARVAMRHGSRQLFVQRLIERLEECAPGNPAWAFGWTSQGIEPRPTAACDHDPVLADMCAKCATKEAN